ncbi:hypothetical protein ZWY2020_028768 [Hordeum vulgare]|nr:hypothetical protein ZWY2020_028768 [Hordeum vulgare]
MKGAHHYIYWQAKPPYPSSLHPFHSPRERRRFPHLPHSLLSAREAEEEPTPRNHISSCDTQTQPRW